MRQTSRYMYMVSYHHSGTKHRAVESNGRGCSPQNAGQTLHESDSWSLHPRFLLGEVSDFNLDHEVEQIQQRKPIARVSNSSCSKYGLIILTWHNKRRHGARPMQTLTVGNLWKRNDCGLQHASQLCQQSRRSNRKKKINRTCRWLSREYRAKTLGKVSYFRYCSVGMRCSPQHRPKLNVENA